ncbi:MAG TPA: zinc ABC transporter substrate-binding protein [Candidatus Saccharicenans sp.]|nr:zinc ABC transporter substrate-binding protein [Candidatus Saccharicenans sp.]HRV05370.1 zinc ABC transporter substrate-binding protein [Candidatus Saccharicenans sp.]
MKKKLKFLFILLLMLFMGDFPRVGKAAEPDLLVVTTIFPLSEFARQITAGQDEVYQLIPTSAEVHDFQLRPSDLAKLRSASILIRIGSNLEPWLDRILNNLDNQQLTVISFTEILKNSAYAGLRIEDPHLWLDFEADQLLVKAITEVLSRLNPARADAYRKNGQVLIDRLVWLDIQYQQNLASCQSSDLVIAGHQAFGYLASRYKLNQIALTGLNPEAQPTPRRWQEVINLIRARQIKSIFFESSSPPSYAREIARETGTRLYRLSTGVNLSKDEINQKKSFLSLMEENLKVLIEGLNCGQQDN